MSETSIYSPDDMDAPLSSRWSRIHMAIPHSLYILKKHLLDTDDNAYTHYLHPCYIFSKKVNIAHALLAIDINRD